MSWILSFLFCFANVVCSCSKPPVVRSVLQNWSGDRATHMYGGGLQASYLIYIYAYTHI